MPENKYTIRALCVIESARLLEASYSNPSSPAPEDDSDREGFTLLEGNRDADPRNLLAQRQSFDEERSDSPSHDEEQQAWDALARFLMSRKLKNLDLADSPLLTVPDPVYIPSYNAKVVSVQVLKRFNSRKKPHLLTLNFNEGVKSVKYIFKEDDDITMDVAIMELFKLSNRIWERRQCLGKLHTYRVMATEGDSGFCECIPGITMGEVESRSGLAKSPVKIINALGEEPAKWETFYESLVGVMVSTAAFTITDRHNANAMFNEEKGFIALIDLSASLGCKAIMEKYVISNRIYFPTYIRKVHKRYEELTAQNDGTPISEKMGRKNWDEVTEDCLAAYNALYEDEEMQYIFKDCFEMPTPEVFAEFLKQRRHRKHQKGAKLHNKLTKLTGVRPVAAMANKLSN